VYTSTDVKRVIRADSPESWPAIRSRNRRSSLRRSTNLRFWPGVS